MDVWCDTVSGELHAKLLDKPPGGGLAVLLRAISVTTGVLAEVLVGCRTPGCLVSASDEPAKLAMTELPHVQQPQRLTTPGYE